MNREIENVCLESDFVAAINKRMYNSKFATSRKEIRKCLTNAIKTVEEEIHSQNVQEASK